MVSKKIEKIVQKFLNSPGYLSSGAGKLSAIWKVTRADIYEARDEARRRLKSKYAPKIKRLFFDIETSPNVAYVWETGYKLRVPYSHIITERKIICISYKWWGEDKVHNLFWSKDQDDKVLLEEFNKIIKTADEVVTHNGDSFDVPMMNGRCAYHGLNVYTKYRSFDTYRKIKAQFKLNSYSLDYCTQYFGVRGKMDTGGFDLWKDLLQIKNTNIQEDAKEKMIRYCNRDVIALEDLYNKVQPYTKPVTNHAIANGGDRWHCPTCASQHTSFLKASVSAMGIIKRYMECDVCNTKFDISNKTYMLYLEQKDN